MLTWSVVALLALWTSESFAVTLQTATVLDAPNTDAPAPDGPRVVILKPTFGDVVKGKEFPLAVQFVAGKHKLALIELLVDDRLVGALDEKGIADFVKANQASFSWDTTRLKDGIYKLTVRVTDSENLRSTMSVHVAVSNVTVDKTAPMITFLQPRDQVLRGRVQVTVQAKDNFGVKSISVYIVSPSLPQPRFLSSALTGNRNLTQIHEFTLNTWNFPNGNYLLFAEVEDFMNNLKMSAPIRIRIANDGGKTPLDPEPPAPPLIDQPPGGNDPQIKPGPPIAANPPRSVGPLTVERSGTPPDQNFAPSQLDVKAPPAQLYVTAPEPRLDPKMTMSHPEVFELVGSGESSAPVDATKPKPQRLASRPEVERRSQPKLSAERGGVGSMESVKPNENPVRSPRRAAQKSGLPPMGARHVPSASSKLPRMTPSEQGRAVGADIGSPPIEKTPENSPNVGTLTDAPRIVSAPKIDAPSRTPSTMDSATLAVPPSPHVGVLPGRKPEHRISVPKVEAPSIGTAMITPLPPTEHYTVKKGDTLASIAAEKRLTVAMIREANPHRKLTALKPGQTILLPRRLPIYVNGELLARPDEPIGAFLMDSIALAPFRHVFERSGGFVDWNGPQRLVTGVKGAQNVQLRIGDRTALLNGQPVTLQAEPFILYGRTHVPIRFFEQALNLYVEWDVQNGRVVMLPK
jgi:LysM repeat protein